MRLSVSKTKLFKACRRKYELRYIYGLKPVESVESLKVGTSYHQKLEELYKTGDIDVSDFSKESAMALAYKKYIYPNFSVSKAEKWLDMKLPDGTDLVGIADGVASDGRLVEHKTTSGDISVGGEYEYGLQWDEQTLMYALLTGAREFYYTVCKKPTIRKTKKETDEEFFIRMCSWYDEDTETKIRYFMVTRTNEEVEEFRQSLLKLIPEIQSCDNFYKNTLNCNSWGRRCEYSQVCLNYDPNQTYIGFEKEGEYVAESQAF